MLLTCLVSLLTAAQPDAGLLPLTRTHALKWLPVAPDQSVRARVDVETFSVGGEREAAHVVEVLTVSLPDGGTTPALDKVNEALHAEYRPDWSGPTPSSAALADGSAPYFAGLADQYARGVFGGVQGVSVTMPFLKDPFLHVRSCVDYIGAYPSVNCSDTLIRLDTGAAWAWLDAIPQAKQKAFLEECSRLLAPVSKAARADYEEALHEVQRDLESLEKNFPARCAPPRLTDATLQPNGDLHVIVNHGTHADPRATWGFTLPAAMLAKWADPKGPLGAHPTKR